MNLRYNILLSTIFLLISAQNVYADSDCWPEEKLIGTSAIGIYRPPFGQTQFDFKAVNKNSIRKINCNEIVYAAGSCGDEHAFIPVWSEDENFLKVRLVDQSFGYLKTSDKYQSILDIGSSGTLSPVDSFLFLKPDLNSKAPPRDKKKVDIFLKTEFPGNNKILSKHLEDASVERTYDAKDFIENEQGTWVKVDERLFIFVDGGPEIKKSDIVRTGFILHRNSDHILKAVFGAEWCD